MERIDATNENVVEVLRNVLRQAKVPFVIEPFLSQNVRVTLHRSNVSLEAVLLRLGEQANFDFRVEGGVYHIVQGDIDGFLPDGPPETPVLLAAGEGQDRITRSRFLSLGRAIGTPISWSERKGDFRFYVAKRDAGRASQAFRADRDLNANGLSLAEATSTDRFFSLPASSLVLDSPLPPLVEDRWLAGVPLDRLYATAIGVPEVRHLSGQGWSPTRFAASHRATGYEYDAAWAYDLFLRLDRKGQPSQVLRMQIIDGKPWFCGKTDDWPRDYAHGLQKNDDANWPLDEGFDHLPKVEGQPDPPPEEVDRFPAAPALRYVESEGAYDFALNRLVDPCIKTNPPMVGLWSRASYNEAIRFRALIDWPGMMDLVRPPIRPAASARDWFCVGLVKWSRGQSRFPGTRGTNLQEANATFAEAQKVAQASTAADPLLAGYLDLAQAACLLDSGAPEAKAKLYDVETAWRARDPHIALMAAYTFERRYRREHDEIDERLTRQRIKVRYPNLKEFYAYP